jgi:hypothetical protein
MAKKENKPIFKSTHIRPNSITFTDTNNIEYFFCHNCKTKTPINQEDESKDFCDKCDEALCKSCLINHCK